MGIIKQNRKLLLLLINLFVVAAVNLFSFFFHYSKTLQITFWPLERLLLQNHKSKYGCYTLGAAGYSFFHLAKDSIS